MITLNDFITLESEKEQVISSIDEADEYYNLEDIIDEANEVMFNA